MYLHKPGFDYLTVVCVVLVLVHGALEIVGEVANRPDLYELWGLSRSGLLEGRLWQFVTYAFLHGSWAHLLGNVALLYLAGGALQRILAERWFLIVFLAGAIVGGAFHLVFHPGITLLSSGETAASGPLVGASGGAMAVLISLTALAPDARVWPFPIRGRNIAIGIMLAALLLYLCTPTLGIPGLAELGQIATAQGLGDVFRMAHACHFGGGVAGFFLMRRFLRRPITLAQLQEERARKEGNLAA